MLCAELKSTCFTGVAQDLAEGVSENAPINVAHDLAFGARAAHAPSPRRATTAAAAVFAQLATR